MSQLRYGTATLHICSFIFIAKMEPPSTCHGKITNALCFLILDWFLRMTSCSHFSFVILNYWLWNPIAWQAFTKNFKQNLVFLSNRKIRSLGLEETVERKHFFWSGVKWAQLLWLVRSAATIWERWSLSKNIYT